jgi:hypothetical protein
MYNMELMRLLRRPKMQELKHHTFKEDGTTIALFLDEEGKYSVSLFDRSDIEVWTMEFDNKHDANTEFNKRVAEGPIDKRTGAKR